MSGAEGAPPRPAPEPDDAVAADYERRAAEHDAQGAAARRQTRRLERARLLAFLAILLGAWLALGNAARPVVGPLLAAVALALFAWLVRRHGRARRELRWHEVRSELCRTGARRVRRLWDALPPPDAGAGEAPAGHPYAAHLDVVGHASLWRLVDAVRDAPGRSTLGRWLLEQRAAAGEIAERQAAVRELAPLVEWRETLSAHAELSGASSDAAVERFLAWAEREPWLARRPLLRWGARLVPVVIVAAIGLVAALDAPWAKTLLAVSAAGGLALTLLARRQLSAALLPALARHEWIARQQAILAHAASRPFASARAEARREELERGGGAAGAVARLGRVTAWGEARYSPLLYAPLQLVLLWDFHVVAALERWQAEAGHEARAWFGSLGEIEALAALATLAHDNPRWATPAVVDGAAALEASALGHPLIAAGARVPNDVAVGPPGTLLLVTGSNMSGKSTLLRAVGLNAVLAQAGAPVCAAALRMPPLDVHASVRVSDSLERGVSLFMAELEQLKRIVDAARQAPAGRPVLYLLDEILHGTNSAERRVAVRTVLGQLLRCNAVGAITTHDLALAADGALAAAARTAHFSESVTDDDGAARMTFDYQLRPGLAASTNALVLLRLLGLDDPAGR